MRDHRHVEPVEVDEYDDRIDQWYCEPPIMAMPVVGGPKLIETGPRRVAFDVGEHRMITRGPKTLRKIYSWSDPWAPWRVENRSSSFRNNPYWHAYRQDILIGMRVITPQASMFSIISGI